LIGVFDIDREQLARVSKVIGRDSIVRNRLATEPVMLKVHNVKLSFDIWLLLYIYFILYS